MAGMSALTVRANMKMMFDEQSANKAQANYMNRLAKMEQDATSHTSRLNNQLLSSHEQTVAKLEAKNKASDQRLADSKEAIAKRVAAAAGAATKRLKPVKPKAFVDADHKKAYKAEERAYKDATNKIAEHQKKIIKQMKKEGVDTLGKAKPGTITTQEFVALEVDDRKQIVKLMGEQVRLAEKGSTHHALARKELNRFKDAHEQTLNAEKRNSNERFVNDKKARQSEKQTLAAMKAQNRLLKERMALYHRVNGAIDSIQQQVVGGLRNALMMSGIAIMSFGYKIQQLTSDFIAFEKELMNAQSIYQQSFDILYDLSDQIVSFGTQYGVALQDASEGLYTLASAGLSADDSLQVLQNTLKLSMAVQGDHDTIAKLTTQTLFGFGKEMSESGRLTDMFAHSINKSLIEYQDLASSVKFAMPFFVATNQEVEQLLGALQILSNRALEAGIAGRGLRQTLAEFAQHAEDNTAAFRKLGVELLDSEGKFKDLTVIAKEFHSAFPEINDNVELMTTLLEDLNVRGATAFVHLVREAEGFQNAVDDLQNSTGAATDMANIQQQSLANQIQVIKNSLMAPFLLSDQLGREGKTLNTFGAQLEDITRKFENLFITTAEDGTVALTKFGKEIQESTLILLEDLSEVAFHLLNIIKDMNGETNGLSQVLHILIMPLKAVTALVDLLGDGVLQAYIHLRIFKMVSFGAQAATIAMTQATYNELQAQILQQQARITGSKLMKKQAAEMVTLTMLQTKLVAAQMASNVAMMAGFILIHKQNGAMKTLGYILLFVAGAMMAVATANMIMRESLKFGTFGFNAAVITGGAAMVGFGAMMKSLTTPPAFTPPEAPVADMGMRMYDMGGGIRGRHFPVLVEPGETIVPKTQNMLGGSGITLNIQGDVVTNDAEDFAERIAQALPEALRMQNDIGGI